TVFSEGEKAVTFSQWDASARVWDLNNASLVQTISSKGSGLRGASMRADLAQVALASENGQIALHDLETGALEHRLESEEGAFTAVAYAASGVLLADA